MDFSNLHKTRGTILSRLELIDQFLTVPTGFSKHIKLGYVNEDGWDMFISVTSKYGLALAIDNQSDTYEYQKLKYIPMHIRRIALEKTLEILKDLEKWYTTQTELNVKSILDADEYIKSLLKKGN